MNSKEALSIIKYRTEDEPAIMGDDIYDMLDLIEKDLEKLEQAKRILKGIWDVKSNCYTGKIAFYCSEEAFNEIKEWLENEK